MGLDSNLTGDIPMLVALIILFIGLYFRGLVLWISLAIALLYLYIFDRESIITLVIYGWFIPIDSHGSIVGRLLGYADS